jgi:flagellar basal-body rod protein FlgB
MARLLHYRSCPENLRPIVLDRIDSQMKVMQKALSLRSYRQDLLASNIANADTPHYKARDVDFRSALDNALSGRMNGSLTLTRTAAGHIAGGDDNAISGDVKYRTEYQSAVDGNTVNMDVERAAFAENAVHMEALLTFLRGDIKDLQAAIQGQ